MAPFLHCPVQSSRSFAQVAPPQPSRHVHWKPPGLLWQASALMQGPKGDAGFESHSSTSGKVVEQEKEGEKGRGTFSELI